MAEHYQTKESQIQPTVEEQEPIPGDDNSSLSNPRDRFHREKQFQYDRGTDEIR